MKVIVCGSIGYGGIEEIRRLQSFLRKNGYEVLDQLTVDYSNVKDFRDKPDLWEKIVKNDLELCERADVIIFIATNPSFGAMAEVVISSMKGKPIIAYCPKEVKSPWPLYFATAIVKNEDELLKALNSIKPKKIRTIPNVYGEHETEFIYNKFTCICPVTGRRDYGIIKIRYKPKDKLIEYESLDEYFKEFKDKAMHHEAVVRKIFNDLLDTVKPYKLEIIGDFEERSGVKAIVKCSYQLESRTEK
ncbi:MAG TPA: preQ(1) synthase [Archaeoglobus profundus]|nr:preQ(1) synthase [Archaeoglobus profundus]